MKQLIRKNNSQKIPQKDRETRNLRKGGYYKEENYPHHQNSGHSQKETTRGMMINPAKVTGKKYSRKELQQKECNSSETRNAYGV